MDGSAVCDEVFDLKAAQACLDENRHEEAVSIAEIRLKQVPDDIDAKIILCQGLLRLGKLERLHQLLQEVDATICRLSKVYIRLGELCRISGLLAEADNFISKYEALSSVFAETELLESAGFEAIISDAVSVEPVTETDATDISPEFYTVTLADLYLRQGHLEQARKVLETIVENAPGNMEASRRLLELNGASAVDVPERPESAGSISEEVAYNHALVAKLESWLVRINQLRSHGV
jgi:uncharacterized protein HemY